ncbi:MAG: outer membrane beta-barrel protein [Muribaculaceae bacterium]|nr:outer membrane beta-barrel protein [Muribaculaceae bacterium]
MEKLSGVSLRRAVRRILLSIICVAGAVGPLSAKDEFYIRGRVKESLGKTDLTSARILWYDGEGNVVDTLQANMGRFYKMGEIVTTSYFYKQVPRVDSTYVFDVVCDNYATRTMSFRVEDIGKRETEREIPIIYLDRAAQHLKEVTVTTSKIKFYNKGDTIVYNADAFLLAEGSMLDALISQLPGVELTDNGQIKVNGEFVESLLLNGKEFFDGNNNLMLENIAAYTVKDIQVYEGESRDARRMIRPDARKVLTMDVRLKREYNIGWIVNAQGGYGTSDRYLGKLFASWFNPTSRVSLVGNVNNLNNNRTPGRDDTWTPDRLPDGTREYRMAGLNYNHESPEGDLRADGSLLFNQSLDNTLASSDVINFLPGGDTYDRSYADSRSRNTSVRLDNYIFKKFSQFHTTTNLQGTYTDSRNSGSQLSGTFDSDPGVTTSELLDAIYSDGTPELLESVINRSKTRTDRRVRSISGAIGQSFGYRIPKTNDGINLDIRASYRSEKNNVWRDYDINYGSDPTPAVRRRQYTDNTPNHDFNLGTTLGYSTYVNGLNIGVFYDYMFADQTRDSYMYALDRLNDMGIYGVLPEGYEATFMPGWSNTSRTITNTHRLSGYIFYFRSLENGNRLNVQLQPELSYVHRHYEYRRDGRDYPLSISNVIGKIYDRYGAKIDFSFDGEGEGYNRKFRNKLIYDFGLDPQQPDLFDMIEVVNDADPLNIYRGNPDLKTQYTISNNLKWTWSPHSHSLTNTLHAHYSVKTNALTRGYTYDTHTGVRYNRTYNVDGNWSAQLHNDLSWQFGSTKQFTLSSSTEGVISGYSDMIGVDLEEPELFKVTHRSITEKLRLGWQFGQQSIKLRGDFTRRNTTSSQPGFRNINATHVNYGVSGVVQLPAGFGVSTDFMCYTRRGYGSAALDTTDPVWNMRLTYAPPRLKAWVVMLDAFDMLHRLSNVKYAVTAVGRTVSYTNALPRYLLLTVQYRLSIQPKKR